ncbi:MAG: alpha/beta hydrolase [Pseudomonadota bacterium]
MNNFAVKEGAPYFNQDMNSSNPKIHFQSYGDKNGVPIIWAHGWGQSHKSFEGLIQSFENIGHHIAIDFPGFGDSPEPTQPWGTEEYAAAAAAFIKDQGFDQVIWIGHSFGCRVGVQLASRHPELIKGLGMISGAGLPRKRSIFKSIYFKLRIAVFKLAKTLIPLGLNEDWLRSKFGSRDYKNTSGIMRQLFVKVVNEDLSNQTKQITCPVTLIYGENDDETPPDMGERYAKLINGAELTVIPKQDHYTVLGQGRHQVTPLLKNFIESLKQKT